MSVDRAGKALANEEKCPFVVEIPVLANGYRRIIVFHKLLPHPAAIRTHHLPRQATLFFVAAFLIWRWLAPLSNSLAARFTKQSA
jgi:hypothetical protein